MAYRLKLQEPLDKGLSRILLEQIDRCVGAHQRPGRDETAGPLLPPGPEAGPATIEQVHEMRKALKRTRAALRLVRSGVDAHRMKREMHALRDAARTLSARRDADVRRATLTLLEAACRPKERVALKHLSALLSAQARAARAMPESPSEGETQTDVRSILSEVRERIARLELDVHLDTVETGLRRTHAAGHRAIAVARCADEDGTGQEFHDLRKTVQTHWRQMQLLVQAWPSLIQPRVAAARALSQMLGDENDLSAFAAWVADVPGLTHPDRTAIIAICRREQAARRPGTLIEARRLFAASPKRFAREVITLWRISQAADAPGEAEGSNTCSKSAASSRLTASAPPRRTGARPAGRSRKTPTPE